MSKVTRNWTACLANQKKNQPSNGGAEGLMAGRTDSGEAEEFSDGDG